MPGTIVHELQSSWSNHVESWTRWNHPGIFTVRYEDLLTDWVRTTMHVGTTLDLQTIIHTRSDQIREVHRFIDPNLRRVTSRFTPVGFSETDVTRDDVRALLELAPISGETSSTHVIGEAVGTAISCQV